MTQVVLGMPVSGDYNFSGEVLLGSDVSVPCSYFQHPVLAPTYCTLFPTLVVFRHPCTFWRVQWHHSLLSFFKVFAIIRYCHAGGSIPPLRVYYIVHSIPNRGVTKAQAWFILAIWHWPPLSPKIIRKSVFLSPLFPHCNYTLNCFTLI